MRKFMITILTLAPMALWAQDNTWERPEEEQQEEVVEQKVNPMQNIYVVPCLR